MMLTLTAPTFPSDGPRPACVGQSELFDATDRTSHEKAKAICRECPVMAKCAVLATTVEIPTGTWAGRLHGLAANSKLDIEAEASMFTEDEAREAYNAWGRGERTPLNKIGRRVYKRYLNAGKAEREEGLLPNAIARRFAEEDAMFTDEEARRGASAYRQGDQSDWNALAQRVHKRRQRHARREATRVDGAA